MSFITLAFHFATAILQKFVNEADSGGNILPHYGLGFAYRCWNSHDANLLIFDSKNECVAFRQTQCLYNRAGYRNLPGRSEPDAVSIEF